LSAWYVYILRCADGSFYTGITTDVARRLEEHNGNSGQGGNGKLGARYTRSRRPVSLAYVEAAASRGEATKREAAIRRLGRAGKVALCGAGIPHASSPITKEIPSRKLRLRTIPIIVVSLLAECLLGENQPAASGWAICQWA